MNLSDETITMSLTRLKLSLTALRRKEHSELSYSVTNAMASSESRC